MVLSGSLRKQNEAVSEGDEFAHRIEAMRDRVTGLNQKVNQLPLLPQNLREESFEELRTVLEELRVVQEYLLVQNEQLVAARQVREAQPLDYQALFDFAPDAYLVTDTLGTIQEANRAASILLNISQKSLVGKPLVSFVPLEERKVFHSQFTELGLISTDQAWEVRLCPCNGKPVEVALRVAALQDKEGKQVSLAWLVRDITLAKQAQAQRLRESENRWQTIVETEPECIKIVAPDGTLLEMNPAGLAMIEASSASSALGQSVYSLIAPEHKETFIAFNKSVCEGDRGTLEFEIIGLQGTRRWMETHAVPLRSESHGGFVHLAITRDITARKLAEAAIKQAKQELEIRVEERTAQLRTANNQLLSEIAERQRTQEELEQSLSLLHGTLEATADGIIVSQNGRYIASVNQKFVEMWGIPEAVIASRELNQLLPLILQQLKDSETFLGTTQELLCQPDAEGYGIVELKDGRIFERYSLPQRIGGKIVGRVCSFRDITKRQRAEAALRESEARYRAIVEDQVELLCRYQPDGTLTFVNDAYCRYFNKKREELIGHRFTPLIPQQNREKVEKYVTSLTPENAVGRIEHRVIMPNGEIRFQQWSDRALFDEQGNLVEFQSLGLDITERKLAEEALNKAYDQLEIRVQQRTAQLSQALGQLQSEMAERKLAEAALRSSQQQLQAILDNSPAVIYLKDTQGRHLLINRQFETLFHIEREALKGKTDYEIFPSQIADAFRANDQKVLQSGTSLEIEEVVPQDDGLHTFLSIKFPLYDLAGVLYAVCGISTDITERKQAQEELQRSEARFRELAYREALVNRLASQIRNSLNLDTILETTVQEIYNHLEIDACVFAWYANDPTAPGWDVVKEAKNRELPSYLGLYPLEACSPFTCKLVNQEIFSVDNVTLTDEAVQQMLLADGMASILSLPIQTQSGELGVITCGRLTYRQPWADEELELLQAVANQLCIGINQAQLYEQSRIVADIAQTKATELEVTLRELQQTQAKLIQSEKMSSLGQLVAGVAHEINNPLNFIHGNLTHVNKYAQDLLDLVQLYQVYHPYSAPEIQAHAKDIELDFIKEDLPKTLLSMQIGADRIREIVLSLRNFSRLDEAEMKRVDIHSGLDNTLLILAHRLKAIAERPAIEVIKDYGNLPQVECYAGQLNQVFMNILNNAIDSIDEYNEERTKEDIRNNPSIIRICTKVLDNNSVMIRIADNGCGMTEEIQRRLFDPFFTTKPVGSGTGLGMSISYQIVEKHGGQLTCISTPGQGAEFLIQIPIHQCGKKASQSMSQK